MKNRRFLLLITAFFAALAVLLILAFYQHRQERYGLFLMEDPEQLVQQIESEADLLREFQQERAEAGSSVAERLLIENLIDLEKEKIRSLTALADIQLKRLAPQGTSGANLDPEVRALQDQIDARKAQLQSLPADQQEKVREEMHQLQHRLELAEVRSEQRAAPAPKKLDQLTSAQLSLIQDRLRSIEKGIAEEKAVPRTDRIESSSGMWADIAGLLRVFSRSRRIDNYRKNISRQEQVIDAFQNKLLQGHTAIMKKLSGEAGAQVADISQHHESEQQIEGARKIHAAVKEQTNMLSRWADSLARDSVDLIFQLLARMVLLAIVIIAIMLVAYLLREVPERFVHDEKSRYYSRKIIGFLTYLAMVLSVVFALVGQFAYIGPALGLVGAGIAIALQDVIVSVVGWFFIIGRLGLSVGDRVEIDKVKGDVIDIGVFRTVMLEIGNWVTSEQATGRVVFFPNSFVFRKHFFNYHIGTRYVWDELQVTLTYESNWRKAKEAFLKIASETVAPDIAEAEREMRMMARRFLLKVGKLTPIVYTQMADSGVLLMIRYVVPVRARRSYYDEITEKVLSYVEGEPDLDLAYPTRRNLSESIPHVESQKEVHRKLHPHSVDRAQGDVAPIQERTPTAVDVKE
ncbi:MAG TPA: mechanosensitive ion channel domain-containing protein [Acidobacteriota bacterium]|jgi:small-conductance mechanosensitive channel|nr:mechanosensitive ion channel domain-containing protein [Acidobacteriota bacterium]